MPQNQPVNRFSRAAFQRRFKIAVDWLRRRWGNARETLRKQSLANQFFRRYFPHLSAEQWRELAKVDPMHLISILRDLSRLYDLERDRVVHQEHPRISHVAHAFRMGNGPPTGGDTSDLLEIPVRPDISPHDPRYYLLSMVDFTGHGLFADKYREILQTYLRGRVVELRVRPNNVDDKLKSIVTELHHYFKTRLPADVGSLESIFAQAGFGFLEVRPKYKDRPSSVRLHYLDLGGESPILHDPSKPEEERIKLLKQEEGWGHPSPFLVEDPKDYRVNVIDIAPWQSLILHTDGLTDARSSKHVHFNGKFLDVLKGLSGRPHPEQIANVVMHERNKHLKGSPHVEDDTRLRVIQHHPV